MIGPLPPDVARLKSSGHALGGEQLGDVVERGVVEP
jgi:hypothetical protein